MKKHVCKKIITSNQQFSSLRTRKLLDTYACRITTPLISKQLKSLIWVPFCCCLFLKCRRWCLQLSWNHFTMTRANMRSDPNCWLSESFTLRLEKLQLPKLSLKRFSVTQLIWGWAIVWSLQTEFLLLFRHGDCHAASFIYLFIY